MLLSTSNNLNLNFLHSNIKIRFFCTELCSKHANKLSTKLIEENIFDKVLKNPHYLKDYFITINKRSVSDRFVNSVYKFDNTAKFNQQLLISAPCMAKLRALNTIIAPKPLVRYFFNYLANPNSSKFYLNLLPGFEKYHFILVTINYARYLGVFFSANLNWLRPVLLSNYILDLSFIVLVSN